MLEIELTVNDRVSVAPLGIGSVTVEGTITEVHDAGKEYVSYTVAWDDFQFPGERWSRDDLDLPKVSVDAPEKSQEAAEALTNDWAKRAAQNVIDAAVRSRETITRHNKQKDNEDV